MADTSLPPENIRHMLSQGPGTWNQWEAGRPGLYPLNFQAVFDVSKQLGSHAVGVLLRGSAIPGYILVLEVLELIGSLLFLFLLGLAIRNLFRLK
jgi:hypothetical protein